MRSSYEVVCIALPPACSLRRRALLLAGAVILLSGCGQPPAATNLEIARTTTPVEEPRAVVAATTTDAVGPLSVEELAHKTALEAELARSEERGVGKEGRS